MAIEHVYDYKDSRGEAVKADIRDLASKINEIIDYINKKDNVKLSFSVADDKPKYDAYNEVCILYNYLYELRTNKFEELLFYLKLLENMTIDESLKANIDGFRNDMNVFTKEAYHTATGLYSHYIKKED